MKKYLAPLVLLLIPDRAYAWICTGNRSFNLLNICEPSGALMLLTVFLFVVAVLVAGGAEIFSEIRYKKPLSKKVIFIIFLVIVIIPVLLLLILYLHSLLPDWFKNMGVD